MDKSWTKIDNKVDPKFMRGAMAFAEMAKGYVDSEGRTHCPCNMCLNVRKHIPDLVCSHIIHHGFLKSYEIWTFHGESRRAYETDDEHDERDNESNDGIDALLDDAFHVGAETERLDGNDEAESSNRSSNPNVDKLFADMEKPLFPGCDTFSVLGFILRLMHVKVTCKMTNKSMDMILKLLREAFKDTIIPKNHYEAKKYLHTLGLGYESIHVCKNDCDLFWKEKSGLQSCPVCGASRWVNDKTNQKKIPAKVMRYFPITSRLKRLYASRYTAEFMQWHARNKSKEDGVLRHPSDGKAWKHFDTIYPDFAKEPRNVRLGLASDGFNPFGTMSTSYSTWPVVLIPYNMPPWKSNIDASFMMTLLIPGKDSPGKDIDVYLRPLVDELKLLWEKGVETYDSASGRTFNMRAALMWTINDFPAYGYLSGWSTGGYMACPICNEDASSIRIRKKIAYVGHRRYLPNDHPWRKARDFNGKKEVRAAPKHISGEDCLRQLENVPQCPNGKSHVGQKRKRSASELNWSKKSIFFELPYWCKLLMRHNIDVMHVEKNVCENLLGTLLNIEKKTKDTELARLDLQDMKIRKYLHLVKKNDRWTKPPAPYVLTREERKQFCSIVKSVRFPDGYAGNLAKNVILEQGKIYGLKSHDCHVLLQRVLPIAVRGLLDNRIRDTLVELSRFFKILTSVTLNMRQLETLQEEIVKILCKLERIFPPSFFTVMVHLCVHLPQEAILGGPVQSRWMYPVERYLGHLKKYVRNKARPEGSIAEGYVVEEALTFCSHYLRGVDSRLEKHIRNDDQTVNEVRDYELDIFRLNGRGIGKRETVRLSNTLMKKAEWFILNNCSEVESYMAEHLELLERQHEASSNFSELQESLFPTWFSLRIRKLYEQNPSAINEELYALSRGPDNRVTSHGGYIVNGVKFLVKSRDDHRKTQNCGVTALGIHGGVEEDYYGYVDQVLEFSFIKGFRVILFQCIWYDTDRKRNHVMFEPHFISIDTTKQAYKEDPFVLANQAKQVFYINDPIQGSGWKIIERSTHRHLWDIPDNEDAEDLFEQEETPSHTIPFQASDCENFEFHQDDGEEEFVEIDEVDDFEDDLDDFIDDETISNEINEELPETLPEDLDDNNETNGALYDESDDEYEYE